MACTSLSITSHPLAKDTLKEQNRIFRAFSGKDLCGQARIRRSYSENHLCYSINRIRASNTPPQLKNSPSMGIFNFKLSGSILPNSLRSFLFDPETSKEMDITENSLENDESNEAMRKRSNWIERLMELQSHWRERQHNDDVDGDGEHSHDCDEDDRGCEVDYGDEEEEGNNEHRFGLVLEVVGSSSLV